METLMPLIYQLITGAVGGNIIGALAKKLSLGVLGNSIAGIVGGGLGGQFLGNMLGGGLGGELAAAGAGGGPRLPRENGRPCRCAPGRD